MALTSSPVCYPLSSSPTHDVPSLKRKRILEPVSAGEDRFPKIAAGNLQTTPKPDGGAARRARPCVPFPDDEDDTELGVRAPASRRPSHLVPAIHTQDQLLPDRRDSPSLTTSQRNRNVYARTSLDGHFNLVQRHKSQPLSDEGMDSTRSTTGSNTASRNFYGIDIHSLIPDKSVAIPASDPDRHTTPDFATRGDKSEPGSPNAKQLPSSVMWTEKYRARAFTDLVGDDRTHRDVLRWFKSWDPLVFPGSDKPKHRFIRQGRSDDEECRPHRKVLLLTGSPGLGKTTLAHVCARQAGYEVLEINASDERTSHIVKGRIKDCVGTENVKSVRGNSRQDKTTRPICVVVDEVDGALGGTAASGEGGFNKALIDLINLDQINAHVPTSANTQKSRSRRETFRMRRPLVLICNDVYSPSLRPLRTSNLVEIIHVKTPPLEKVVTRLQTIFRDEGLPCDDGAVRKLCEATWGSDGRKEFRSQAGTGGDLRGCLVAGEWLASKLRASVWKNPRLTKTWVDENLIQSTSEGSAGVRSLARGGTREIVERVFQHNAGFANLRSEGVHPSTTAATGVDEAAKRLRMYRLKDMVDNAGEADRIIGDCFTAYPSKSFQDDTFLSKPNAAGEWLYFHDRISSRVHCDHEWELGQYLSQPVLAFHELFASPSLQRSSTWNQHDEEEAGLPFSGPMAAIAASEATKQTLATLQNLQSCLSMPLSQHFATTQSIAMELVPDLVRMLTPNIKPIVVGASGESIGSVSLRREVERQMLHRSVAIMHGIGMKLERLRIEATSTGQRNFVYRFQPSIDTLALFETGESKSASAMSTKYGVCQAMDQEYQKLASRRRVEIRDAPYQVGGHPAVPASLPADPLSIGCKPSVSKRDFFGRPLLGSQLPSNGGEERTSGTCDGVDKSAMTSRERKAWVSFHDGFSNAVRKPITLNELLTAFE